MRSEQSPSGRGKRQEGQGSAWQAEPLGRGIGAPQFWQGSWTKAAIRPF